MERRRGLPSLPAVIEPTESATAAAFAHTAVLAGRPDNAVPPAEAGRLFGRLAHLLDAVEDLQHAEKPDTGTKAARPAHRLRRRGRALLHLPCLLQRHRPGPVDRRTPAGLVPREQRRRVRRRLRRVLRLLRLLLGLRRRLLRLQLRLLSASPQLTLAGAGGASFQRGSACTEVTSRRRPVRRRCGPGGWPGGSRRGRRPGPRPRGSPGMRRSRRAPGPSGAAGPPASRGRA